MASPSQTTISCVQCRQPVRVTVANIVDAAQTPQAKIALLNGSLNAAVCPNCGTPNAVLTPLLYHDASKEMLIVFVPMEMGLSKDAQEKAVGDLVRQLTSSLPQGSFKAYMLQPRQALTLQGLVEQVLEGDGITQEMMQTQRERVRLVEQFIQSPPELIPSLVQQHDARIDAQFMQTMTLMIQQLAQAGRMPLAQQVAQVQQAIIELSSFGQQVVARAQAQESAIAEVADALNALDEQAGVEDYFQLALSYVDDEDRLQALVGLIRPVFDYAFFQNLTVRIGQAPSAQREGLEMLRERLLQLTALVDQQAQQALQEAAEFLKLLYTSPDPDPLIQENLAMIDYTFMQVLAANIQDATQRGDINATSRLRQLHSRVVAALQANMPPELQFINELINLPDDWQVSAQIAERAASFGQNLMAALESVEGQLAAQPQVDPGLIERLQLIRSNFEQALG